VRIDLDRVASTAIETTLNGRPKRRRRRVVKTLAAGAIAVTAARAGQKHLPSGPLGLMKLATRTLGDLREVKQLIGDRLAGSDDDGEPDDHDLEDVQDGDEPEEDWEDEEPEPEDEEDDEPELEEDDDEPELEQDDDEPEPHGVEVGTNGDASRRRAPDPASRPPEPEPAKSESQGRKR
jgi:hypothetical protein